MQASSDLTYGDAVEVAPDLHEIVFENDKLRVLNVTVEPGARAAMHGHPENINYILEPGVLRFTKPDGSSVELELKEGQVTSSPSAAHAVENIGGSRVRTVQIEFKT